MALAGIWSWLGDVAGKGMQGGIDGMVDDDLAYVRPWGFAPEQVGVPVLFVHGEKDRIVPAAHSDWLARRVPDGGAPAATAGGSHLGAQRRRRGDEVAHRTRRSMSAIS